jgi:hypothetical protein
LACKTSQREISVAKKLAREGLDKIIARVLLQRCWELLAVIRKRAIATFVPRELSEIASNSRGQRAQK